MRLTYTGSLSSTSVDSGTTGGGTFIARTASDSSSESSAAFLEKRMLMLAELREASGLAELDSTPMCRSNLSLSDSLLASGDRAAFADVIC